MEHRGSFGRAVGGSASSAKLLIIEENDRRLHQNLVMLMDRRLSNVHQQQYRYELESRGSLDGTSSSVHSALLGSIGSNNNRQTIGSNGARLSNGSIVKQPKSSRCGNDALDNSRNNRGSNGCPKYFAGFTESYVPVPNGEKRRRPSLWETLTGLVCSLGALATRAAKMAARRGDSL